MAEAERRRRRVRHAPVAGDGEPPGHSGAQGPAAGGGSGATAATAPVHDPPASADPVRPETGNGSTFDDREAERGLRGLVGSGSSQVSVTAALRARDAARPTEAELATAESDLVIIRRGWVPRDPLTR